jgi:hypothetical protein
MTNIPYVVCPGHFLCCSVTEWPPLTRSRLRRGAGRRGVSDAGDVRAHDDGLVVPVQQARSSPSCRTGSQLAEVGQDIGERPSGIPGGSPAVVVRWMSTECESGTRSTPAIAYVMRRGRPQIRTRLKKQHRSLSRFAQPACQDTAGRAAAHAMTSHSRKIGQFSGAGEMFWLNRKTLSGSYLRLTSASRAYVCGG